VEGGASEVCPTGASQPQSRSAAKGPLHGFGRSALYDLERLIVSIERARRWQPPTSGDRSRFGTVVLNRRQLQRNGFARHDLQRFPMEADGLPQLGGERNEVNPRRGRGDSSSSQVRSNAARRLAQSQFAFVAPRDASSTLPCGGRSSREGVRMGRSRSPMAPMSPREPNDERRNDRGG
jgi:hypothetical protein